MSFTEIKTRLKATIWQAVAQSGVDLSSLPQAEQDKLVTAVTEVGGVHYSAEERAFGEQQGIKRAEPLR